MHPLVFPYKKVIGGFAPIIPVTLYGPAVSAMVEAYVDSGAIMSLFDSATADVLRIDWVRGVPRNFIVADGRMVKGFAVRLRVAIGDATFIAPIAFVPNLKIGFNLLGRSGIFSQFDEVAFQETRHQLVLR